MDQQSALLFCLLPRLRTTDCPPQLEPPIPSTVPLPTLQGQLGQVQEVQKVFPESNYSHLSTCPSHQGRGQLPVKTATHVQAKMQVQVQGKVQVAEALELTGLSAWPSLPFSWQQEGVWQD